MGIFQPSTQIKLTNVSIVRLKKGGKRFEVACYRNKIAEWRSGVEKDLDEVLQIHSVFVNVSKGQLAKTDELTKAFKTDSVDDIIKEILAKGEQQVGDKERGQQLESLMKEIASIVAEKCVNPQTKRPYPVNIIEKAIVNDLHYSVSPSKTAKQQALDVIKQLQEKGTIPIARAQMRVKVVLPGKDAKKILTKIKELGIGGTNETKKKKVMLIDPGHFRALSDLVQTEARGRGQIELLNLRETAEGDGTL
ncbi:Shwachman-Bodian-diamond syndrome protein [Ramicandelaber brevisporus]|nr:Shwachman-Bodian-diamond syndrome protein [Ramicandelaber brevisporus]